MLHIFIRFIFVIQKLFITKLEIFVTFYKRVVVFNKCMCAIIYIYTHNSNY